MMIGPLPGIRSSSALTRPNGTPTVLLRLRINILLGLCRLSSAIADPLSLVNCVGATCPTVLLLLLVSGELTRPLATLDVFSTRLRSTLVFVCVPCSRLL